MTPRVRPCGIPECRICRWNDAEHRDSGHVVEEPWAEALVGTAAIVLLAIVACVLLPVMVR